LGCEVYGDVLGPALEDYVAALTEAARSHLELDLGRVGIRGSSSAVRFRR
jgi:dipeptidyl-peptidase-4